jgi:hypothetical protein
MWIILQASPYLLSLPASSVGVGGEPYSMMAFQWDANTLSLPTAMSDRQQTCVGGANTAHMQMFVSRKVSHPYFKRTEAAVQRELV